jgi:HK97 gp10 family phage protein
VAGQRVQIDWNEEEWSRGMADALSKQKIKTEDQLAAVGLDIQNNARNYCPVDTGRLRSSVKASGVQHDDAGAFIDVGTNVAYSAFVEFGTDTRGPQPYLRPAFLNGIQSWVKRMGGQ